MSVPRLVITVELEGEIQISVETTCDRDRERLSDWLARGDLQRLVSLVHDLQAVRDYVERSESAGLDWRCEYRDGGDE